MPEDVRFDLTIFTGDGDAPVWGSATGYVISEASFSTLSSHPRPYLQVPENFHASKTDFLKGASDIGGVTFRLLDVPRTAGDQTTGILTDQLKELNGGEVIARRWYDSLSAWRTIFRGRVKKVNVVESMVEYTLDCHDPRAFEERDLLFETNETFSLYPQPGPIANYGQFPSGEDYLLPAAAVAYTRFRRWNFGASFFTTASFAESTGGVYYGAFDFNRDGDWNPNSFIVGDETLASPYEVFVERIDKLRKICDPDPTGVPIPASATSAAALFGVTRLPVFRGFTIRWRLDDEDDWNYIRDHPAPPQFGLSNAVLKSDREYAYLYASSFDPDDLPPYDTAIEMQVLARYTTSDTPYFHDSGTVGDILHAISQGDFTRAVPRETYEASSLADFRTNTPVGRFIETSPQNRRRWVQSNVFQPVLYAPCLTQLYELRPVPWTPPADLATTAPFLAWESIEPEGNWGQEFSTAYNTIDGTIIVENIRPQEFITRQRITWYKGIDESELNPNLSPWERYEATETQLILRDEDAVAKVGPRPIEYSPKTLRSIGEVDGRVVGGDTEETSAGLIANEYLELARTRFIPDGAPRFPANCLMSDPVVRDAEVGDWLRVETPWFPDRTTGLRGAVRYMQVYGITDVSPERRILHLEDGGIPAFSDDDITDPEDPTADCLDNATTENTSATVGVVRGLKTLVFSGDGEYELRNDCAEPVDVDVLLMGGGGGGGGGEGGVGTTVSAGGGGGAGGVVGAYGEDDPVDSTADPLTLTLKANTTYKVTVGAGGAGGDTSPTQGANGGSSIIWIDVNGDPLDPLVDDPADAVAVACGGGGGGAGTTVGSTAAGEGGGSGGGGGGKGGAGSNGFGGGAPTCQGIPGTQGGSGGGAFANVGTTGCNRVQAGGGGSFGGDGEGFGAAASKGGDGADGVTLTKWGITTGGGGGGAYIELGETDIDCSGGPGDGITPGSEYNGVGGAFGAGGGGGSGSVAQDGTDGIVLIRYVGAAPGLTAPAASVETPAEDTGRRCVTVAAADWPAVEPSGYRVRVDYAVAASEPAANSGLWIPAGYLYDPGTICTPLLATGATIWTRVVAESDVTPPSTPSTPSSGATGQVADLLVFELVRIGTVVTAGWTPNASCVGIKFHAYVATAGTPYDASLLVELDDVDATDGTWPVPFPIAKGDVMHVVAECWDGFSAGSVTGTEGNSPLRSLVYAVTTTASPSDVDDALDSLAFDADHGLILDADVNPVRHH